MTPQELVKHLRAAQRHYSDYMQEWSIACSGIINSLPQPIAQAWGTDLLIKHQADAERILAWIDTMAEHLESGSVMGLVPPSEE